MNKLEKVKEAINVEKKRLNKLAYLSEKKGFSSSSQRLRIQTLQKIEAVF